VKATGEVFTPMPLVRKMVREIPEEKLRSRGTSLDPACGDGNFLVGLRKHLGAMNGDLYAVNHQIYGCDLMPDNVARARRRVGLVNTDQGWGHVVAADFLENNNPWYD
jgi:type I restriction-modification system DNA methylase subunit